RFLAGDTSAAVLLGLACSIVTGVLSVTKTAVLGAPILLLAGFVMEVARKSRRNLEQVRRVRRRGGVLTLSAVGSSLLVAAAHSAGFPIWEYIMALQRPTSAFVSRYDAASGNLADAISVIREYPILGVGRSAVRGEFIGDSGYVGVLHD